ncbi:unnamed protein product [Caenorhabditis sp. 36 PRJEB53466]|nr:unnamed protein product [Caenorhabditis sp. 36 PRJEB53466]
MGETYIQVNIYENSLQTLSEKTNDLTEILKTHGFTRFSIGEVRTAKNYPEVGQEVKETTIELDVSVVKNGKQQLPRSSTPISTDFNLPLLPSFGISRISTCGMDGIQKRIPWRGVDRRNRLKRRTTEIPPKEEKLRREKSAPANLLAEGEPEKTSQTDENSSINSGAQEEDHYTTPMTTSEVTDLVGNQVGIKRECWDYGPNGIIRNLDGFPSLLAENRITEGTPSSDSGSLQNATRLLEQFESVIETIDPMRKYPSIHDLFAPIAGLSQFATVAMDRRETSSYRPQIFEGTRNFKQEFARIDTPRFEAANDENREEAVEEYGTEERAYGDDESEEQVEERVGKPAEELVTIKCEFRGCMKSFKWKKKFGKLQLLDHALLHGTKKMIHCRSCGCTTMTTRQMKNHMTQAHPGQRFSGYGMKDLNIPETLSNNIWRLCFSKHLETIGIPRTTKRACRRKREKPGRPPAISKMEDSCTSYVQINIYGKKLEQLKRKGFDMTAYLAKFGCDKFWMGDISLCESSTNRTSDNISNGKENSAIIDATTVLSVSVSDVRFPRTSTPIHSDNYPSLEQIPVSNIKRVESTELTQYATVDQSENTSRASGTVRRSLQTTERKLGTVTDEPTLGESLNMRTETEYQPPTIRSKSRNIIPKEEVDNIAQPAPPPSQMNPPFTENLTSGNALTPRELYSLIPFPSTSGRKNSERVLFDMEPMHLRQFSQHDYPANQEFNTSFRTYYSQNLSAESYEEIADEPIHLGDTDVIDYRNSKEHSYVSVDYGNVAEKGDETEEEVIRPMDVSAENNAPVAKSQKSKGYVIQCFFKNCGKSFSWKAKYGRVRLIDHALTHLPGQEMKCSACKFTCQTIRNMRYHNKRKHRGENVDGIRIRKVINSSQTKEALAKVWDICYKKNGEILGNTGPGSSAVKRSASRRKRGRKAGNK